jgi:hypothetical protein
MAIIHQVDNQRNPCIDAINNPRILHSTSKKEPPEDRNKEYLPIGCGGGENLYYNDWDQKLDRPGDDPNL